jgi:hypothetical protein
VFPPRSAPSQASVKDTAGAHGLTQSAHVSRMPLPHEPAPHQGVPPHTGERAGASGSGTGDVQRPASMGQTWRLAKLGPTSGMVAASPGRQVGASMPPMPASCLSAAPTSAPASVPVSTAGGPSPLSIVDAALEQPETSRTKAICTRPMPGRRAAIVPKRSAHKPGDARFGYTAAALLRRTAPRLSRSRRDTRDADALLDTPAMIPGLRE